MKTFKNLLGNCFEPKILLEKFWPMVRKRKTMTDQRIVMEQSPYTVCIFLSKLIKGRRWYPGTLLEFERVENGKLRNIQWRPGILDSMVQEVLLPVLEPILKPRLILDTYSGLKGRGPSLALKRMSHHFRSIHRQTDGHYYIYTLDIHHYYPSIEPTVLKKLIRHHIADDDVLFLLDRIIDSYVDGLPFGDILSPLFANLYLDGVDKLAKEKYRFKCYGRYCDNIIVACEDRKKLEAFQNDVHEYLEDTLFLQINQNEQIYPNKRGSVEFVGTMFNGKGMRLRMKTERRFRRAARRHLARRSLTSYRSLASYWGMLSRKPGGWKLWNKVLGKPLPDLYKEILVRDDDGKPKNHIQRRYTPSIESEDTQAVYHDSIPRVFSDNCPEFYNEVWLRNWQLHRIELRQELNERNLGNGLRPYVSGRESTWYYPLYNFIHTYK